MTQYVALLRGIGPDPNMRGDKLRGVMENLGYTEVRPVLNSGNVVFSSTKTDKAAMEAQLEAAWPARLGFTSTTIMRSRQELEALVAKDPFNGMTHSRTTNLNVTFFKNRAPKLPPDLRLPYQLDAAGRATILSVCEDSICSVTDVTGNYKTPNLMAWLEKTFGKDITTRTWNTINRILAAMERSTSDR